MNIKKHQFGHRRRLAERQQQYTAPLTNRTNVDVRNSAMNEYKITFDHDTIPVPANRYSYDTQAHSLVYRKHQQQTASSLKRYQNISNTLTQLKKKIDSAKNELVSNRILNKNIIFEEPDDEELRPFELVSFSNSSSSQIKNVSSLDQSKKQFLQQLRKNENIDVGQLKGYYKAELAKNLRQGSGEILNHLTFNWKVIRSCGSVSQPSSQDILRQKQNIKMPQSGKRTLVLGLDGTLVCMTDEKINEEDIDVTIKEKNGQEKKVHINLRPYAMTFLKRMSKLFQVVIFSQLSKGETEAIMDVLDPFNELVKLHLSQQNCMKVRNNILTKDLRILGGDLAQTLLVDCQPYSYIFQIDNAVPITRFQGGQDQQLYSLEKYLMQANRSGDLRQFNINMFLLRRYSEYGSALQAVQHLYAPRR